MAYNNYQEIPINKFIYRYDDPEDIMKSMKIQDQDVAEVISTVSQEDEANNEEIKNLINKLRIQNEEIENDMEVLENISPSRPRADAINNEINLEIKSDVNTIESNESDNRQ